ncbi:hypothetical protein C2S51_021975 [Perilla frutescens var. frutescens]|nr:hypothetical protein C2S51_021975 [Perilla frutescens var. frutescens]
MERVNVIYHYKGRWMHIPELAYIEGDSKFIENVDIDYLSFTHMLKAYKEEFGVSGVKKLCYVKPGIALASGQLNVIENDDGIKKLTELIKLSFHPTDTLRIYPLSNGDSTTLVGTGSDYDQLINDIINELVVEKHIQSNDERERIMETNDGETGGQHRQPIDKGKEVMQTDDGETFVQDNVDLDSEEDELDINSEAITIQLINQLAIRRYSVAKCTPLKIKPNDSERLRAKCKTQGCPFHLYISKDGNTGAMIVRRIEGEHNCLRDGNNSLASAKFLALEFKDKIYTNPRTSVKEIIADVEKRMKLYVSKSKGKRAKRIVMHELDGSFKAEFANIGAYAAKIKEENPGTTVELEICEESLRNEGNFKEEFDDNLKMLGDISKKAAEDFVAYNPGTFCRAFFSFRSKSHMVDNNITESFNSSIVDARYKPIVSMLDEMRLSAMKRLATNKSLSDTWIMDWSPACLKSYQSNLELAFGCKVMFNGDNGYEIGDGDDRHKVFLDRCICTCRLWELTGIPCSHAICAIKHAKQDPKAFISNWYHKLTYMASYEHVIEPMAGKLMGSYNGFEKVEPPPIVKSAGRPRKNKIRAVNENRRGNTSGVLGKKGVVMSCSICHGIGHNRARCPNKNSQSLCMSSASNQKTRPRSTKKKSFGTTSESLSQVSSANPSASMCQPSSAQSFGAAKGIKKNKRTTGLGILIDENSGNMILNPGFSSERLVLQNDPIASQALSSDPDVNVRYPIPNEKEIRQTMQSSRVLMSSGNRQIAFTGDGSNSIAPDQLPFKPPGLKWKGKRSITATQLQNERDKKRAKKGDTNKS